MIQSSNKYQIARTCAAAGYTNLYRDLVRNYNLLPEVNVLFEAHDSGCKEIYHDIVDSEQVYTAMDDYIEQFHDVPQKVDYWYNDTVTARIKREKPRQDRYVHGGRPRTELSTRLAKLMDKISNNQPLPRFIFDDKDILILYAAYNGHVDAHLKLRRINSKNEWLHIENEINCAVHSIYYSDVDVAKKYMEKLDHEWLKPDISAKLIMNNDLSLIHDELYCIWYPQIATEETYRKLVQMYPREKYIVGRACAVAGYTELYKSLDLLPDQTILDEAVAANSTEIEQIIREQASSTGKIMSIIADSYRHKDPKHPLEVEYKHDAICYDSMSVSDIREFYDEVESAVTDDGSEITSSDIGCWSHDSNTVGDWLTTDVQLRKKLENIRI